MPIPTATAIDEPDRGWLLRLIRAARQGQRSALRALAAWYGSQLRLATDARLPHPLPYADPNGEALLVLLQNSSDYEVLDLLENGEFPAECNNTDALMGRAFRSLPASDQLLLRTGSFKHIDVTMIARVIGIDLDEMRGRYSEALLRLAAELGRLDTNGGAPA